MKPNKHYFDSKIIVCYYFKILTLFSSYDSQQKLQIKTFYEEEPF